MTPARIHSIPTSQASTGGCGPPWEAPPTAPVSRAVVKMGGGQKGLFVNSRNLCVKAKRNRARVNAKGQNGRRALLKPRMRAQCGKAKRKAKGKRARVSRALVAAAARGRR